jgi:HK97 family phage major capsid protein
MKTSAAYNRAFWNLVRGASDQYNDLNEGSDYQTGAYFLPNESTNRFLTALSKENLFRRIATTINATTNGSTIIASDTCSATDWVPENGPIPEAAQTLKQYRVQSHKLAGITLLQNDFIQDSAFDVESYLTNEFARCFGKKEEAAFINGDGVNQPCGILHPAKGAEVGVTASAADSINFDEVIRLFFSLDCEYRNHAVWVMNDETALALRKLKDASGNYLWRNSDDTILGKPVLISNFMPSPASGEKAIAFGDFSYYWLVERQNLSIRPIKEKYILTDRIAYIGFEFLDGCLIRQEAIKLLQMGA